MTVSARSREKLHDRHAAYDAATVGGPTTPISALEVMKSRVQSQCVGVVQYKGESKAFKGKKKRIEGQLLSLLLALVFPGITIQSILLNWDIIQSNDIHSKWWKNTHR